MPSNPQTRFANFRLYLPYGVNSAFTISRFRGKIRLTGLIAGLLLLTCGFRASGQAVPAAPASAEDLRSWGLDTLGQVDKDFFIPARGLYADTWKRAPGFVRSPAFMWGCGVQLPALIAAARLDPKTYRARMVAYADALDVYWSPGNNGVPGYDVLPGPKSPDRYYDDNAWMVLALTDVYDTTKDVRYRDRAEDAFRFVMSGEDSALGGGIYWHEQDKRSKNTCVVAPAIVAALRLYSITRKPDYLRVAKDLYNWINAHLQDTDGLFWDNIRLDGAVEKMKWTYNSALMLRANCLLYSATRDRRYLQEAERIAHASAQHWIKPDTGAIGDSGAFAHMMCEAWLALYNLDHDPAWLNTVRTALAYVHSSVRDPEGHYGDRWDRPVTEPLDKVGLLSQASVVRAFLFASAYR